MTTNQEGVHAAIRAETGTSGTYLDDWHALFTADGIAAGPWNARMIAWVNATLGTSYTSLNDAMNAFAIDQGFTSWQDMNTLVLAVSGAMEMLDGETQGLALDFTDDHFFDDTGFYGSAAIKDTTTPANNYDGSPVKAASSLLTYSGPSAKLTRGPGGVASVLRYQAHNLYLNSASPANQSITVVSGATYAVTITGTVSVTASGAATGTWTAGTNTFTAATTTLTLGSTSGTGTVHVRRTPSDSTYLATAGSARYDLPYEWDTNGDLQGIRLELARTNLALNSENFTHTSWNLDINAGNVTRTANQAIAPDGTMTADKLVLNNTKTAVSSYIGHAGAGAAVPFASSVYMKKAEYDYGIITVGAFGSGYYAIFNLASGTVAANPSAGSTSASIESVGSGWYRCTVMSSNAGSSEIIAISCSSANNLSSPGDGSSGIYIWGAQQENGSFPTSYIQTFGSTVTRAADSDLTLATSAYPHSATVNSGWIEYVPFNVATAMVALRWDDGTANEVVSVGHSAAAALGLTVTDGGAAQTAPLTSGTATANATERIAFSWKANDFLFSDNGAAAVEDTSGTLPTVTSLDFGPTLNGYIKRIVILPVEKSAAEVAAMATA